jgi:hypothetical protein
MVDGCAAAPPRLLALERRAAVLRFLVDAAYQRGEWEAAEPLDARLEELHEEIEGAHLEIDDRGDDQDADASVEEELADTWRRLAGPPLCWPGEAMDRATAARRVRDILWTAAHSGPMGPRDFEEEVATADRLLRLAQDCHEDRRRHIARLRKESP